MLKVVWVVPGFSGDEKDWCIPALLDLARALAQECNLTIVSMRYPYRRATYRIGNATVISIGGGHPGPAATPGIWRDTIRAVQGLSCDVLHAFWAYEPGMIAARFTSRTPVVISLAGGEVVYLPEIRYGLMGRLRTRLPVRWALKRAHAVTAGSEFLLKLAYQALPLSTLRLLPFGVDLRRWPCSRHDANPGGIINVGSLEPVKAHALLIRAFSRLIQRLPSARLRIVGAGQERVRLERLALDMGVSEKIELVGPVPHHELPAILAGASLFAQASWHEAQGMALLEAAACGLPITGTEVGALAALAPHAAIATPVGDANLLAAAMLRILENPNEAAELGMRARATVEQAYPLETSVERCLQLYHSLV